jgi:hypothetical protein
MTNESRAFSEFNHSFVLRHSCFAAYKPRKTRVSSIFLRGFVILLIHIAFVAFVALQFFDVFVGLFEAFAALRLHNFA